MNSKQLRKIIQEELLNLFEQDQFKKTVYGYKKTKVTKTFSNKDQYIRWKEQNSKAKDPVKIYITDQDGNESEE